MLRRKLLKILLYQTGLLMVLAVAALWSLHGLFVHLDELYAQSRITMQLSNDLNRAISTTQLELYALQAGQTHRLDPIIIAFETMRQTIAELGDQPLLDDPEIQPAYASMAVQLNAFERHVALLATWQDPVTARQQNLESMALATRLRTSATKITEFVHARAEREQAAMLGRFRLLVLGLAVGFMLAVNGSILLLMRTSVVVLRPVEQLVDASRALAGGDFGHRVSLGRHDEFDELGEAFNHLAQQLEQTEKRRLETLGQAALTLNHELNNAAAIIELQLSMMQRRAGNASAFEQSLRQIHESLQRMTRVIESLKHVRRIVLTDYLDGVKMLDLERSVRDDVSEPKAAAASG